MRCLPMRCVKGIAARTTVKPLCGIFGFVPVFFKRQQILVCRAPAKNPESFGTP
jgi:hypothetical protein